LNAFTRDGTLDAMPDTALGEDVFLRFAPVLIVQVSA